MAGSKIEIIFEGLEVRNLNSDNTDNRNLLICLCTVLFALITLGVPQLGHNVVSVKNVYAFLVL